MKYEHVSNAIATCMCCLHIDLSLRFFYATASSTLGARTDPTAEIETSSEVANYYGDRERK